MVDGLTQIDMTQLLPPHISREFGRPNLPVGNFAPNSLSVPLWFPWFPPTYGNGPVFQSALVVSLLLIHRVYQRLTSYKSKDNCSAVTALAGANYTLKPVFV